MQKNPPDNFGTSSSSRKSSPAPFIGAAAMVLNVGKVVLGLIGKGIRGSVRLLMKRRPTKISGPKSNAIIEKHPGQH